MKLLEVGKDWRSKMYSKLAARKGKICVFSFEKEMRQIYINKKAVCSKTLTDAKKTWTLGQMVPNKV